MRIMKVAPPVAPLKEFDRFFDRFLTPSAWPLAAPRATAEGLWEPALDFSENPKEYVVRMEIPGVARDDLDVNQELAALRGQPQGIEAIVCDDITERQAIGINKYGTTVANNPLDLREWLQHAYEECLDQAIYLRRAISQIEKDPKLTSANKPNSSPLDVFIERMRVLEQMHEGLPGL